jgi:hypothetical protein
MQDSQVDPERRKMVLVAQIIVAALVAGCLFFMLIVLVAGRGHFSSAELGLDKQPLTTIGLIAALVVVAARLVVPRVVTGQMLQQLSRRDSKEPEWNDLFSVYQTILIIKAALVEGVIFLLLVVHMIEHSPWSLALAVAFMAVLLLHVPSASRVDEWIERQSMAIREQRSMQ